MLIVTGDSDGGESWEYDEYREISGATSATGSLEIVTIDDTEYVHAKSLGSGSFTTSSGTVDVNVGKASVDVFVIAGQSNTYASIYIVPADADPVPNPGTAYYYGTTSLPVYNKTYNPSDCSMVDMVDSSGSSRVGSWWPALAAKYYEDTGHKTYFINTGLSGQPIATFMPGGSNWDHVDGVIRNGISAIDTNNYDFTPAGYIWVQGEGDRDTPIATYEFDFITIDSEMKDGTHGVKLPLAFISKVRTEWAPTISTAQIWLADNVDGVIMGSELPDTFSVDNGLMVADNLHYSQAGCNALGESLASTISENISEDSNKYEAAESLLSVVPILVIVGIILGVIGMLYLRRE